MYYFFFQATVDFEVHYIPPDDSIAAFDMLEDDQQMLMDIEQNIANIERNLATAPHGDNSASERRLKGMKRASTLAGTQPSQSLQEKRRTTLKTMRTLIR